MSLWNRFRQNASPEPAAVVGPVSPEDVCRRLCRQALLWERYLFEDHTRKQLSGWARRLNYFRFARAYGGHNGDGDQLIVVLRVDSEAALLSTCAALGIVLQPMPDDERLAAMPVGERPSSSRQFPGWQQPGHVVIAGARLFAWLGGHLVKDDGGRLTCESIASVKLSLADPDNIWDVTEAAVVHAEAVERTLAPLASQLIEPPQDDRNCISPKRYPEMFGLWHRATAEWPWDEPDPR